MAMIPRDIATIFIARDVVSGRTNPTAAAAAIPIAYVARLAWRRTRLDCHTPRAPIPTTTTTTYMSLAGSAVVRSRPQRSAHHASQSAFTYASAVERVTAARACRRLRDHMRLAVPSLTVQRAD